MDLDEESYASSMELDELTSDPGDSGGKPHCLGSSQVSACDTELLQLEGKCDDGKALLQDLTNILQRHPAGNIWLQQALKIAKSGDSKPKVIIGLVGSTGAGKSSVINALLDEEQLVPTSCMRASTATVTEISYHYGPGNYAAEVEFISPDIWESELRTLFDDIADGVSNSFYDPSPSDDSDFAIAYAKCNAVYGFNLREMSSKTLDQLMSDEAVSKHLGATVRFSENDVSAFYQILQRFVDSTENNQNQGGNNHKMALWPLIKLVRIHVKAPVLSTGAVLVDLPGLLDTNSARGSVAKSYIQKCSALWVVAPITRAVDDGTASSLLGDTFKRQMQLDGGFGCITFVCSKSDEINILEAAQALGLSELDALKEFRRYVQTTISKIQGQIQHLNNQKSTVASKIKELDSEKHQSDTRLHQSGSIPHKRRISDYFSVVKRPKIEDPVDNIHHTFGKNIQAGSFDSEMKARLEEQKLQRKELVEKRKGINQELKDLRSKLNDLKRRREEKEDHFKRNCILLRNVYSKARIQRDFETGIRALDESDGKQTDRDYEKIGKSLPVFCVSSRAYQKLQGRFNMESAAKAFETIDDTEIPQLQSHCVQATVIARKMVCIEFLNELEQIINTLSLQANSVESALIGGNKEEDKLLLQAHLEGLKKASNLQPKVRHITS